MARRTPEHHIQTIMAVVRDHGTPMSVREIAAALPLQMPQRTLQARIAAMVRDSRLVTEGAGRATRYRLPRDINLSVSVSAGPPRVRVELDVRPALSEAAESFEGQGLEGCLGRIGR